MSQIPPIPRECGKRSCHVILDPSVKGKKCSYHAELERVAKRRQRANKAAQNDSFISPMPNSAESPAFDSRPGTPASRTSNNEQPELRQDASSEVEKTSVKRLKTAVEFANLATLLTAIKQSLDTAEHMKQPFTYRGSYSIALEDVATEQEVACDVANAIWKATGYRFTHNDYPKITKGTHKRMWCCQSSEHAKPHRPVQKEDVKRRENPGWTGSVVAANLISGSKKKPKKKQPPKQPLPLPLAPHQLSQINPNAMTITLSRPPTQTPIQPIPQSEPPVPPRRSLATSDSEVEEPEGEEPKGSRQFCPLELRNMVVYQGMTRVRVNPRVLVLGLADVRASTRTREYKYLPS
ncbi:hypothetical protein M408DRAFT_322593 [Serendipita vermifera MAFF 305830]|uniref:Uncharacterized protein n=1 Tax=Serendipita vermifera MAFF 305830 TaxID=933852 RepID=A0A0C3ARL5_SERVB|nr:hypothetical protein M408DRAFT_322593 [Serendipita vermifera MAFF 305830]